MNVLILENLKREHPDMIRHLGALLAHAKEHPEILPAVQAFCTFAIEQFDECGQQRWTMRDMLTLHDMIGADGKPRQYYALKHDATYMVKRLVATSGLEPKFVEY